MTFLQYKKQDVINHKSTDPTLKFQIKAKISMQKQLIICFYFKWINNQQNKKLLSKNSSTVCHIFIVSYEKNPQKAKTNWFQNQLRLFYWILLFQSFFASSVIKQFVNQQILKKEEQWIRIGSLFHAKSVSMLQFEAIKLIGQSRQQNFRNWGSQESELLQKILQDKNLINRWGDVARLFYQSSKKKYYRSSKQCRQQWFNHLDNSKKHGEWLQAEDLIILKYVLENGHKWSQMCKLYLPHRTQHMVKNRFKSMLLKYKLTNNDTYREIKYVKRLIRSIEAKQKHEEQMNINHESKHEKLQLQQKCQIKQVKTFGGQHIDNLQDENMSNSQSIILPQNRDASISIDDGLQEHQEQQQVYVNNIQQNSGRNITIQAPISFPQIINPATQFSVNPSLGFNTFYYISPPFSFGQSMYQYYTIPTNLYSNILQFNPPIIEPPRPPQPQNPES